MSRDSDDRETKLDRRAFLRAGAAAATIGALGPRAARAEQSDDATAHAARALPTRKLGSTGLQVSIVGLGGQAAIERPHNAEQAVAIVQRALDLGINYIDTAAWYGEPERWSQRYIGEATRGRRDDVVLATKTHDRTRDGSLRLLEESLHQLETECLDVWQIHNLVDEHALEQVFAPGGVLEAMTEARDQGLVRFLGITGHADPDVLAEALRRFPFDVILMSLNAADPHYKSFERTLLPGARERGVGIAAMKIPARGRLLANWTPPTPEQNPWGYAGDRAGTLTMEEALAYVLTLPVSTAVIGCDSIEQLEENVALARRFAPLKESDMAALRERAKPVARQALFFRSWPS